MSGVLNDLGQTIIPSVFSSLNAAGLTDTMTIKQVNQSQGSDGGMTSGTATDYATNVPVAVEIRKTIGVRQNVGDKVVAVQEFTATFPTHHNGSRLNVDPTIHYFVVNTRGNEPAKTYRVRAVPDDMGVVYEATCERQNVE